MSAAGAAHVAPASVECATRMSPSVSIVSSSESNECHTATQFPSPSVVSCGNRSSPASLPAFVLSATGAVHVAPPCVERTTRMSLSVSIVPSSESLESHTATQLPCPSVVTCAAKSSPAPASAFPLSAAGAVQVTPASVERATKMSPSAPTVPSSES